MTQLVLSFLGTFQASLDDQVITSFRSLKVQGLLAYLSLEAQRPHAREVLAAMFWPDDPDASARQNLRQSLYQLRQLLGEQAASDTVEPFLLITRHSVQFNTASNYRSDVADFLACLAGDGLQEAASIYQGDLLLGLDSDSALFEEWLLLTRERLHNLALEILYTLTERALEQGDFSQAQAYAHRQLALEAWREQAHRQLMLALARAGNRTAALAQFETCRRILADELGLEPSAETESLYAAIKAGNIALERAETDKPALVPHNLPQQSVALIGRERDLAALNDLLNHRQARLVTIVGPGGIGKTHLALGFAELYLTKKPLAPAPVFADGIYFVPLASLAPAPEHAVGEQLVRAIATALRLPHDSGSKQQLLSYLRQKRLLLLLDSFEHLPAGDQQGDANTLILELLQAAPQVQLLITARERLNLYEERLYSLSGLALPDLEGIDRDTTRQAEAVQLFIRAAQRLVHNFEPQVDEWAPLARLCAFLGGIPLAIELAATWVDTLSIPGILTELQRSLDLLDTDLGNVDSRHRSMRQLIDYSWQRLSPDEQSVVAALALFRGDFTQAAAQRVAAPRMAPIAALRLLSQLVQKSLLHYNRGRDRYVIQALLRQFASAKLEADVVQATAVRQRHSTYYCTFLQAREADLKGVRQQAALAEIEADIDNIRLAWNWALDQGDLIMIAVTLDGLFNFYDTRSWFQEGETVFREAAIRLEFLPPGRIQALTQARLWARQGWFAFHLGRPEESLGLLRQSLAQLQKEGAALESLFNLNYLGAVLRHQGQLEEAGDYLRQALELAQRLDDRYYASISLNLLGQLALLQDDYSSARRYCQESLRLKREIGDQWGMTYSLTYLGQVAQALGDLEEAQRLFEESRGISETMGDQRGVAFALRYSGNVAYALGRYDDAAALYETGLAIFSKIGSYVETGANMIQLGEIALAQGKPAPARASFYEGIGVALETGAQPLLFSGVLAMARLWLESGQTEQARICLEFMDNYTGKTPAQQKQVQQLKEQLAAAGPLEPVAPLNEPDLPGLLQQEDSLETFVKTWLFSQ